MIQIIIEGNSGQLRMSTEALDLLTGEEMETLFEIGKKLKERQNNDRI